MPNGEDSEILVDGYCTVKATAFCHLDLGTIEVDGVWRDRTGFPQHDGSLPLAFNSMCLVRSGFRGKVSVLD